MSHEISKNASGNLENTQNNLGRYLFNVPLRMSHSLMKTLTTLTLALFCAVSGALAQNWNTNGAKPTPLAGTVVTQNQSNVTAHAVAQAVLTNTFSSGSNFGLVAPSQGWLTNTSLIWDNTLGLFTNSANAFAFIAHAINLPYGGNSRFVVRMNITNAAQWTDGLDVGFSTNAAGVLPTDDSKMIGMGPGDVSSDNRFFPHKAGTGTLAHLAAWGTRVFTNGIYDANFWSDGVNIGWAFIYPGHTNEFLFNQPWSGMPVGTMSNFVIMWQTGKDGRVVSAGGRVGNEELANPSGIAEYNSDFVQWSPGGASGKNVRVVVPKTYDAVTNVPDLLVFCHGNGGDEFGDYDATDIEGGRTVRDYFNWISSNNVIVASYSDPGDGTGRKDSWGTSNSVYCVDATINYVRQRWAFKNVILWGESAGGPTARDYALSSRTNVTAIIYNHGVYAVSNSYAQGINVTDQNFAYGGSTIAQLACTTNANGIISGDSTGLGIAPVTGVPTHVQASFGDTVVPVTNQTDILIAAYGGVPPKSNSVPQFYSTNSIFTPEISVYEVNGAGNTHGDLVWGWDCATNAVNFIKRVRTYPAWINPALPTALQSYKLNTNGAHATPLNF